MLIIGRSNMLQFPEESGKRLGVLCGTGGAFLPNDLCIQPISKLDFARKSS
jgi:hypothetical protein